MKSLKGRKYELLVFSTVVIGALVTAGLYLNSRNDDGELTEGARVVYDGTIKSMDLSGMAVDGPGVFVIESKKESSTVHLDAGFSMCDREAIIIPEVNVGDSVRIAGDKGPDDIIRVCEPGTYIKP